MVKGHFFAGFVGRGGRVAGGWSGRIRRLIALDQHSENGDFRGGAKP